MDLLLERSLKALKEAAAKGALTWKGKKVVLDPFLPLGFHFEISPHDETSFFLAPHITCAARTEPADKYELLTPLGALQGGTFRLWQNPDHFEVHPSIVTNQQLELLIKEGLSHRFKGEKPRLKPAPLPILKLVDRTGGFANLYLDYGAWGEVALHDHLPTEEELHWERDLLETGFKKKITGEAHYFCPLDQVGKSVAFLLEMGWKVFDFRGKRVVKQQSITCHAQESASAIILRGTAQFGQKELPIQDVV